MSDINGKNTDCPFEQEVLMNLESGDMKPHIDEHMAGCPLCRETASVYRFMNRYRNESMAHQLPDKKLPSADAIWDGAFATPAPRPLPDKELVKKAMLPMLIPQVMMYISIIAGLIYLMIGNFGAIGEFFTTNLGLKSVFNSINTLMGKGSGISLIYLIPVIGTIALLIYFIVTTDPEKREVKRLRS
ncbi:MAG: hypothetical protein GY940_05465 [bacterium]|nr:hypothetical protein [bacterium]